MDGHTQSHSDVAAAEIYLCDVIDSFGDFVEKNCFNFIWCIVI